MATPRGMHIGMIATGIWPRKGGTPPLAHPWFNAPRAGNGRPRTVAIPGAKV